MLLLDNLSQLPTDVPAFSVDGHLICPRSCDYFTLRQPFCITLLCLTHKGHPSIRAHDQLTQTVYLYSQGWIIAVKYILAKARNIYSVAKKLVDNYSRKRKVLQGRENEEKKFYKRKGSLDISVLLSLQFKCFTKQNILS